MKKTLPLLLATILLLGTTSCATRFTIDLSQGNTDEQLTTQITKENHSLELLWNDEFTEPLNTETIWELSDGPRRGGYWRPKAVTQEDGYVRISTFYDEEEEAYIDGAMSTQKKDFLYGYYTARMRFKKGTGHWGAFWIWNWPYEIDIMEKPFTGDQVHHALHWYSPIIEKDHAELATDVDALGIDQGWHVYSVLWLPDRYVFYVDGIKTWEIDETEVDIADVGGEIIFSDEINVGWPGWLGVGYIRSNDDLPDSMDIDWVRVYSLQ